MNWTAISSGSGSGSAHFKKRIEIWARVHYRGDHLQYIYIVFFGFGVF